MRFLVLLNSAAGTLASSRKDNVAEKIRSGFAAKGVEADVRSLEGGQLNETLKHIRDEQVDAVIGGGGDGTLNSIANALAGTGIPFGVLPLGTHNHFAKDIGIPLELDEAVAALAVGKPRDIDVGEVNGRVFLNFSAIGLHPTIVKHRDAQRETLGRGKFPAMFVAMWRTLRRLRMMRVRLTSDGKTVRRITPSVILCNNAHQMEVFGLQNVSYPDRSVLNLYTARSTSRFGLVWLMIRGVFRQLHSARTFETMAVQDVTLDTNNRHARVSIDGEVTDLHTPLHYRIRKGGLKVIGVKENAE